jgi:peptidoglycan/xylan/chitin deacetylase (PgdA/CDA1 family)
MDKRIALRFDIDSISCVKNGLAGLVALADCYAIPMTFFVTMGKAILRLNTLRSMALGTKPFSPHTLKRLGLKEALTTFAINPDVGITHAGVLAGLLDKGHELGLHGGKNHAWWQLHARTASQREIRDDLGWGYSAFVKHFGAPAGFAAPGFAWSETTLACIDEKGFLYASDMDGPTPFRPRLGEKQFSHWQVPVTVQGPSHISLVEWAYMQKQSEQDFLAELSLKLSTGGPAVLYGHPSFEGTMGIAYLSTAVEYLLNKGYTFTRMKDLVPGGQGAS